MVYKCQCARLFENHPNHLYFCILITAEYGHPICYKKGRFSFACVAWGDASSYIEEYFGWLCNVLVHETT